MSEMLKPLTLVDLRGEECHAWISVHVDNSMHCVYFCFKGVAGPWVLMTEESCSDNEMIVEVGGMGLAEENNNVMHRVFDGTPETRAVLEQLVKEQDLAEYARLIGMSPANLYDLKKKHISSRQWLHASIKNFEGC
jgi:hypothetical protein